MNNLELNTHRYSGQDYCLLVSGLKMVSVVVLSWFCLEAGL